MIELGSYYLSKLFSNIKTCNSVSFLMWARNISDKQSGDFVSLAAVVGSLLLGGFDKHSCPKIYSA